MAERDSLSHSKTHETQEEGQVICTLCKKCFPCQSDLQDHIKIHEKESVKCGNCAQTFSDRKCLRKHMFTHHGIKPYHCNQCGKSFDRPSMLKRHLPSHSEEKPFHCEKCEKTFRYEYHLKCHIRMHTGQPPYTCKQCNKSFGFRCNLKRHEKVHTGEKPYGCDICGRQFTRSTGLNQHKRIHTGEKPYVCDICENEYKYKRSLTRHKGKKHPSTTSKYVDRKKDKTTKFNEGSEDNLEIPTGISPLKSYEQISLSSESTQSLIGKKTLHSKKPNLGYFPFSCIAKWKMKKIFITSYKCKFCPKLLSRLYYLKLHTRIHPRLKLYKCIFCKKTFKLIYTYQIHVRRHLKTY